DASVPVGGCGRSRHAAGAQAPTEARFSTATAATAPRRDCPARTMFFSAALRSRSAIKPQEGQTWVRTESRLSPRSPHTEQVCQVACGATAITCLPAPAAWSRKGGTERCPPRVPEGLRQALAAYQMGDPQVFERAGVRAAHEGARHPVVDVVPLAPPLLV